ncbi:MAG: FtsW/RodA/SpoVE family cell cycle protein [Chloroflexi bacterium]|nr:FtsW/RodA/SpoVE family cell cycle protein [Chloroflexota bacterium]
MMPRLSRLTELRLLLFVVLVAPAGIAATDLVRTADFARIDLQPTLVLAGLLLAVHLCLIWRCRASDQVILPVVGVLSGLGLTLVGRLEGADTLAKQTTWFAVGTFFLVLVVIFPRSLSRLKDYKYTWAVLGIALMAATLLFGRDLNNSGARLWLGYGEIVFQPSEILKVLMVIFLAAYLDEKKELLSSRDYRLAFLRIPSLPYLGPLAAMWGLSIFILVGQKDLGPTLLLFGVFLTMLYVASSRAAYVWGGLGLFALAAYVGFKLFAHVQTRVEIWVNPWIDPEGKAYQMVQALLALASGGIVGTGLGYGHPGTIPAVHTDFPFAAIGEELGLLGTLAVVMLFLILTYRGLCIALEASNTFQQLLATGLTTTIGLQALIIIAGNVKLIPITGITLPFVSYGGSSLVANFIVVGLLLRISQASGGSR